MEVLSENTRKIPEWIVMFDPNLGYQRVKQWDKAWAMNPPSYKSWCIRWTYQPASLRGSISQLNEQRAEAAVKKRI